MCATKRLPAYAETWFGILAQTALQMTSPARVRGASAATQTCKVHHATKAKLYKTDMSDVEITLSGLTFVLNSSSAGS